MKKTLFILTVILTNMLRSDAIHAQGNISGYGQVVDISTYKSKSFSFTFNTRSKNTVAFVVCYDKENKFLKNFIGEGIPPSAGEQQWEKLTLSGKLPRQASKLMAGIIYKGNGEFFYDDLSLIIKGDNAGDSSILKNGNFDDATLALTPYNFIQKQPDIASIVPDATRPGAHVLRIISAAQPVQTEYGYNNATGKFADVNGIRLYYETYGSGEPLLLLHGALESISSYAALIPVLAQHYQVIALDTRGHGKSSNDTTPPTYQLYADDVYKFLHSVHLDSANILGWSDGGNTGILLAMTHPEKVMKLAVMGANLYNDDTVVEKWVNDTLRNRIKELESQPASKQRDFELSIRKCLLTEPNIKPADLQKIRCQTLVMAGEKDIIKSGHTKLIARGIPHSSLVILNGATHNAPAEIPEQFAKVLEGFLKDK